MGAGGLGRLWAEVWSGSEADMIISLFFYMWSSSSLMPYHDVFILNNSQPFVGPLPPPPQRPSILLIHPFLTSPFKTDDRRWVLEKVHLVGSVGGEFVGGR